MLFRSGGRGGGRVGFGRGFGRGGGGAGLPTANQAFMELTEDKEVTANFLALTEDTEVTANFLDVSGGEPVSATEEEEVTQEGTSEEEMKPDEEVTQDAVTKPTVHMPPEDTQTKETKSGAPQPPKVAQTTKETEPAAPEPKQESNEAKMPPKKRKSKSKVQPKAELPPKPPATPRSAAVFWILTLYSIGFFMVVACLYPEVTSFSLSSFISLFDQEVVRDFSSWIRQYFVMITCGGVSMVFGQRIIGARVPGRGALVEPTVLSVLTLLFVLTVLASIAGGSSIPQEEWDLSVPGGEPTIFRPYQGFPLFLRKPMAYLAGQEAVVAYLVTPMSEGWLSNTLLKWCNDSGANRHIPGDLADFKPESVRSINLKITVAKEGVCMTATAVGDCDLHVTDQNGCPAVIPCKDVLYVPGVAKNLLSTHCLAQQNFQLVPKTAGVPKFQPGLHFPVTKRQNDRYVPLVYVNGLSYIATRNDMRDSSGRMLTRNNKYIEASRKLGHMSMEALKQTKDCVRGMEHLTFSHFPGASYSNPAGKVGKSHQVDAPGETGTRASRPMALIHWDTLGPTRSKSCQGFHYATVFVDDYSNYSWIYGHQSTADVLPIFQRFLADTSSLQEKHGRVLTVRRTIHR